MDFFTLLFNKNNRSLATDEQVFAAVNAYLTEHPVDGSMSADVKSLLITILRNGVYSTDQNNNITALATELCVTEEEPNIPEITLSSISATYPGGDVTVGTAVTDLTGIVITATYSDGSTRTVTDYTLSGEIAEGNNTITVSYGGKTTTFTVTGVAESGNMTITMSDRTYVGSGGIAYSGDSTDTEPLMQGSGGHGWTSEKVFENDTIVRVVMSISSQTYTNFVAGSAENAVGPYNLTLCYATKFGGSAWEASGDFETEVTVKAGYRLGVFSSHTCEHVTIYAEEVI